MGEAPTGPLDESQVSTQEEALGWGRVGVIGVARKDSSLRKEMW